MELPEYSYCEPELPLLRLCSDILEEQQNICLDYRPAKQRSSSTMTTFRVEPTQNYMKILSKMC